MNGPWAEVDLRVLGRNIRSAQAVLKPPSSLILVVKANAYGHGMVPVAQRAARTGVEWFAVAYVREALELRAALPKAEILLIGVADPEDARLLAEKRITPVITSLPHARALAAAAKRQRLRLPVHLKIDTGMGRLGIPWREMDAVAPAIKRCPSLDVRGLCTHFATIDPPRSPQAAQQIARFGQAEAVARRHFGEGLFRHIASSLPFLFRDAWDCDAVRLGISMYGYETGGLLNRVRTRPILQWKTRVIQVKSVPAGTTIGYGKTHVARHPTRVATISAGYSDGYPRLLSNKGFVLIGGRRCPVIGRVSMNWITVDVGRVARAQPGDEAVLVGAQGRASIWADEVAAQCGTISYEILTGIQTTDRRYIE